MKKISHFLKTFWNKKWLRLSLIIAFGSVLILELIARYYMGLGDTPVYIENAHYEYIYAPNQNVWRFGKNIVTNEHSMRSKPLAKNDKLRVLLIGDSVVNGGAHVDQKKLVSSVLESSLSKEMKGMRVLNISAGSWGPDNAFAYIQQHGHFEAKAILLVFSSHDYHDNMHHRKVVGEHPNWPKKKPFLAITDGFFNYALPKIKTWLGIKFDEYAYLRGHDDSPVNSGWQNFFNYCKNNNIQLKVYLHPEVSEIKNKAFNKKGKAILNLLQANGIEYINGLEHETNEQGFRDNIHLTGEGHARLASILKPEILDMIH